MVSLQILVYANNNCIILFRSCAKTAESIKMPLGMWPWVGLRKHLLDGVHIGATWRIRLIRPCGAAMQLFIKLLWPLLTISSSFDECKLDVRRLLALQPSQLTWAESLSVVCSCLSPLMPFMWCFNISIMMCICRISIKGSQSSVLRDKFSPSSECSHCARR